MNKLEDIIKREEYQTPSHPNGTWSVWITLRCGCELRYKKSDAPKYRGRCPGYCQEGADQS